MVTDLQSLIKCEHQASWQLETVSDRTSYGSGWKKCVSDWCFWRMDRAWEGCVWPMLGEWTERGSVSRMTTRLQHRACTDARRSRPLGHRLPRLDPWMTSHQRPRTGGHELQISKHQAGTGFHRRTKGKRRPTTPASLSGTSNYAVTGYAIEATLRISEHLSVHWHRPFKSYAVNVLRKSCEMFEY